MIRTFQILFFIPIILLVNVAFASDTIIVKKDPRIDVLTSKQIAINKRSSMLTSTGQYKGYRIQVMSTTSRDQAFNIKGDLLSKFPTEKSYVMFQSPYFKVRMGNFLKRKEADAFRKNLNKLFPQGVFIVEDTIEYTPPPEEELPQ
jgi:hypothetical protein